MNFKAKSIKTPGKRQRADAYRGLTYLQLNTDIGTQQISLTRKSSVKRKRPENECVKILKITSVASTQLCHAPSRGAALNASRRLGGQRDRLSRV